MLGSRQFEAVLRDGLAEKIALAPALWDGTVTLPEARERTARFRVAVAEYEEYPIDGETGPADGFDPSSTTRTRTGRRLVFVEHVALAVDIATVSIPKELETMPFLISITGATQGVFKGESLRPDQAGKTVGLGFSYELTSGPAAGTRVHGPVSIIKAVGASSPQIFEALVTHETLTSVLLEFLKTDSLGADVVVYTVKLTDVVVSEIRQKLDPSSQPGQPLDNLEYESVSFVFQQIDVTSLVGNTTATDTLGP
jgi:type VI secretion system secreted protein Hcp